MTTRARPTRRQLLAGGIGAAAGLAGMSAVAQADTSTQGQPTPTWEQDANVLQSLLASERMLEYGAEKALGSGKLGHDAGQLVLLILANEEEHVAALQARLRALHLPRARTHSPSTQPAVPKEVEGLFSDIKQEVGALQGLVQVENLVQSAYFIAVGSFHDPRLSAMAAEVLAVEAQQWTLLELLLHRGDPTKGAPHPAIRGSQTIGKPHTTTSS
jgi:Ferritin-like domain